MVLILAKLSRGGWPQGGQPMTLGSMHIQVAAVAAMCQRYIMKGI